MITPCRYCGETPASFLSRKVNYKCANGRYAASLLNRECQDERLAIKSWNASNDPNGQDLVEPNDLSDL